MPVADCHLTPTRSTEAENCVAACHNLLEYLSDLGMVYTWQVTRGRPPIDATAPRSFVVTVDTPSLLQLQSIFDTPQGEARTLREAVSAHGTLSALEISADATQLIA